MNLKRVLLGEPLSTYEAKPERIGPWKALSTLSADALSSVAYATDAMLFALLAFSSAAVVWSIPIALAIIVLLIILTASYRQTVEAYPLSAGAYSVAKANLGPSAALLAGSALLIDYILTVSVSVAAGVHNLVSAFPVLTQHQVLIGVVVIFVLMLLNLRGVRESAALFVFPTYFFIISILILIGVGFWRYFMGEAPPTPVINEIYPEVPLVLVLRAFASGCAALTGVETISNNVGIFEAPAQKKAKTTLFWMALFLGIFFLGVTVLAHIYGLMPSSDQTLISLLGRALFNHTAFYYFVIISTALVLFRAANTSYMAFPRIASALARDRYLPRQMAGLGDRLVFSNGIIGLSLVSALLLVYFEGDTLSLIPLYALGVFLSFSLSQAGMVAHHLREKKPGWVRSLSLNGVGAFATIVVFGDLTLAKFFDGAWLVVLMIPVLVLIFSRIYRHYLSVGKELTIIDEVAPLVFKPVKHTVVIPISGIHRGVIEALRYALTISQDVRACYVEIDSETTERIKDQWNKWAPNVPFVVLKSPYRSVIQPLIKYIEDVESVSHDDLVTVVVPEFVTAKRWHRILHNQTALFIRAALGRKRGKIVTSVRYHLHNT